MTANKHQRIKWRVSTTPHVAADNKNHALTLPLAKRGIWIGAYAPPAPWESMSAVHDLEHRIGRRLDLVHIYKAWAEAWGQYDEQTIRELALATSDDRRALITWEPWAHCRGINQPLFSLKNIATGKHDPYIRSWAHGLRNFHNVVYLRPMHEMNSNWYPWAGGVNGNNSTDYIAAWRHMHDVFSQARAGNVRWVWSPYALDVPAGNRLETYYPGVEYVDILSVDAYNWGVSDDQSERRWQDADDLLARPYERITELGPQPVWLTELGSAEQGGNKATWLWTFLQSRRYGRLSAVVWFHTNKERDWRITSSVSATTAVAQALAGTQPAAEIEVTTAARHPISHRDYYPNSDEMRH